MPQVAPAPEPAPEATRDQILVHAAPSWAATEGYSATTLRQMAEAADVEAGSICYHFDSKEAILGVVLDAGIDAVMTAVTTRIAALPPTATFRDEDRLSDRRSSLRPAPPRRLHVGQHPHLRGQIPARRQGARTAPCATTTRSTGTTC